MTYFYFENNPIITEAKSPFIKGLIFSNRQTLAEMCEPLSWTSLALFTVSIGGVFAAQNHTRNMDNSNSGKRKPYVGPSHSNMPQTAEAYKKTKLFHAGTIPNALQNNHNTATGVWGLIHVVRGQLRYTVTADDRNPSEQVFDLDESCCGLIEPKSYHRIQAMTDDVCCYVEFWKVPQK